MLDCMVDVDPVFPENTIYGIMSDLYANNPNMFFIEHESFIFKYMGTEYEVLPKKSGKGMVYHICCNGLVYFSSSLNKNKRPVLTYRTPIADGDMAVFFLSLIELYQKNDKAILTLEFIKEWYEV